jgi:ribosomal protein L35AE/L33A
LIVYVKGKHLSYQRGKRNTNPNTSLVKIEGVDDQKAAQYEISELRKPTDRTERLTDNQILSRQAHCFRIQGIKGTTGQ